MTDTIADALDLVPLQTDNKKLEVVKNQDEYKAAKENMDTIIAVGTTALSELSTMANVSQDPRVYRVLTELIAAMVTANKEMIEMKKTNKEIQDDGEQKTVQNNLFVGSTADLAKMLEQLKK